MLSEARFLFFTRFVLGAAASFAIACGGDDHPPPAGELGSGGGGADAGSGRGGSAGRGRGGTATIDAGDAAVDGSMANHGGRNIGGAAGTMDGGGASGSGGTTLRDGGSTLDAGSGGFMPTDPGSIGTGRVACAGVAGNTCASGTACCERADPIARECVSAFSDCSCFIEGSCPLVGCDGPQDCGTSKCCATLTEAGDVRTTGCKATCDTGDLEVCKTASDCSTAGAQCTPFDPFIDTCN